MGTPPTESVRLNSWKEIAAYLGRGIRSVQRWEVEEGLPVHRLSHDKRGTVYAYTNELDVWWESRRTSLIADPAPAPPKSEGIEEGDRTGIFGDRLRLWILPVIVLIAVAATYWLARSNRPSLAKLRPVTRNGAVDMPNCSLSPDGRVVVYASGGDIWSVRTEGGDPVRLTSGPARDANPRISPDGSRVVFSSERESGTGIYEISLTGAEPRLILPHCDTASYSPDGKQIACRAPGELNSLFVSDAEGRNVRVLHTGLTFLDNPVPPPWSPDQTKLIVSGSAEPGGAWD